MFDSFKIVVETFELDHLLETVLFLTSDLYLNKYTIDTQTEPIDFNNGIDNSIHDHPTYLWIASIKCGLNNEYAIKQKPSHAKTALKQIFTDKFDADMYQEDYIKHSQVHYYQISRKFGNFIPCYRLELMGFHRIDLSISHFSKGAQIHAADQEVLPYLLY